MSAKQIIDYRKFIKQIGPWSGVRFLRNQGVCFEDAYEIVLGRPVRSIVR